MAIAKHYNVPVVMVAGDDKPIAEAKDVLGDVETFVVKEHIASWTAKCHPPRESGRRIREAFPNGLKRSQDFKPFQIDGQVKLGIEFTSMSAVRLDRRP